MKTVSVDQFKKDYGEDLYKQITSSAQNKPQQPGYLSRVGTDLKDIGTGLYGDLQHQAETLASNELETPSLKTASSNALALGRSALRGTGAFAQAAFTPLTEAPGVKQATEFVGEKLAQTTPIQKYTAWAQKHPEAAKDIQNVLDITGLLGGEGIAKPVAKEVGAAAKTAGEALNTVSSKLPENISEFGAKVAQATGNAPEQIMNRVARLNPTEEVAFTKVAGKSPGQYLVDTGNFGSPEDIIKKEAEKFIASKESVDSALANLPGEYQYGPVADGLKELIKKGGKIATNNVPAEFADRATQLLIKHNERGLTMSEINEAKRLIERELKLGYNKTLNPDAVQRATNIDSAIRKWQIEKADYLDFKNIRELNKQTQISKFLIDKLANKVVGQQALNNISLTDWVVLSGGQPSTVGMFIAKKFLSSKSVQARIAKMLNSKEVQGLITPKTFKPAGLLEQPKVYEMQSPGVLEGQSKLRD